MSKYFINKVAEVQYQEQQKRVAERISNPKQHGLLVYHGLGSGKTLSSILAAKTLNAQSTVVTPASLQDNFKKEVKKAKVPLNKFTVKSYEKFIRDPKSTKTDLLIVDEAHKLKNSSSKRSKALNFDSNNYSKVLLLTGSPIQNSPSEIAPLINIVSGQNRLPLNETAFNKRYVKRYIDTPNIFERIFSNEKPKLVTGIHNKEDFTKRVRGLVDYHEPTKTDFPTVKEKNVEVDLNDHQVRLYNYFEQKLPRSLKDKIKYSLPPTKQESPALNSFFSAVRQISNTPKAFSLNGVSEVSPKIKSVAHNVTNSKNQSIVYSNYLESGLEDISNQLTKNKVSHGVFTGSLSSKEKTKLVNKYNSGRIKTLLLSSSGGEGLDLKNTREVHILEPHFNKSKIDQVVGRAARFQSHTALPENKRDVTVYNYTSRLPLKRETLLQKLHIQAPTRTPSIDQYLSNMGDQKVKLNEEFLQVLRTEGTPKKNNG